MKENKKSKKGILICLLCLIIIIALLIGGGVYYYKDSLGPVSKSKTNDDMVFIVEKGMSSKAVLEKLHKEKLIKNKNTTYVYLRLNKVGSFKAGTYILNQGMSFKDIVETLEGGKVLDESQTIRFIPGKRLTTYAKQISEVYGYSEEEILNTWNDPEYLKELVEKYWFLTDEVLNDRLYYALEGYLCPDTYQFAKDASIKDITEKMLDLTGAHLNKFKSDIENSDFTIHQMLTMASIVELEGSNSDDRKGVAGVFYNRLEGGWSLGSDVTTYYGAKVEMSERDLWQWEIEQVNDYNTRPAAMAGKLPVGPICNPSVKSLEAAIEPENHDYYYFVADKNGKTYFNKTNAEHQATISKLKNEGLWYVYK